MFLAKVEINSAAISQNKTEDMTALTDVLNIKESTTALALLDNRSLRNHERHPTPQTKDIVLARITSTGNIM
jgi:hypothetical protein